MKTIRFIDLFAGIGGFRYGLENCRRSKPFRKDSRPKRNKFNSSGEKNKHSSPYTCVYSNEWDKYASQIYKKHYGECDTTDIRRVKEIPDHDLLCAGFPCQAFSVAGKRLGFNDTRGTLFFEIARIARDKRPRYLLLENVKGLLSHEQGKTFATILGVLSDLGYGVEWQVLNSKHFGVPQNRERVFIVGHLGGFSGRKVFPIGETNGKIGKSIKILAHRKSYRRNTQVFDIGGSTEALDTSTGGGRQRHIKQDMRIRRLTPTECERLQGFPDGWTEGISDTQRYKCLGNAVTTNVIMAIGDKLKKEG